jgi:hypothetical protein
MHWSRIAVIVGGWRRRQMRTEAKYADEGVEEAAPFGVVRFGEVELDEDVHLDVDRLQDGRRWRGDDGRVEGSVELDGGVGGLGTGVRLLELEEGVDVGVHGTGEQEQRRGRASPEASGCGS